jgi:hypothetical protein
MVIGLFRYIDDGEPVAALDAFPARIQGLDRTNEGGFGERDLVCLLGDRRGVKVRLVSTR